MLVERRASSTGRIQRAKGQRHGCARIPSTLSFQARSGACLSCDTRAMRVSGGACPAKSQTFVQCCRQEQSATSSQSSRRRLVLDTVVSAVTLAGVAIADDAVATTCGVPTPVAAPAPFEGSIQAKLDCSVPGAQINLPGMKYLRCIYVCISDGTTGRVHILMNGTLYISRCSQVRGATTTTRFILIQATVQVVYTTRGLLCRKMLQFWLPLSPVQRYSGEQHNPMRLQCLFALERPSGSRTSMLGTPALVWPTIIPCSVKKEHLRLQVVTSVVHQALGSA